MASSRFISHLICYICGEKKKDISSYLNILAIYNAFVGLNIHCLLNNKLLAA